MSGKVTQLQIDVVALFVRMRRVAEREEIIWLLLLCLTDQQRKSLGMALDYKK